MTFETVPVVHLEYRRFPEYPNADPEQALTALARRFGRVAMVDAEGVRSNQADLEFVQASARRRALWVDAGSRYATDVMDLFIAGAESVTVRWNTLDSTAELEEAVELVQPGTLFLGLEFPKGTFLRHRRDARDAVEVARVAQDLGVGLVFLLDKPDVRTLRALPPATVPRFVQGASTALLEDLQAMGYQGALLAPTEIPEAAP